MSKEPRHPRRRHPRRSRPPAARTPSLFRAAALTALGALALASTPEPADAAGMLVADGGLGGVLEIQDHDVEVTINNGIAVTSVTQVFRNTEDRQVEALYTFPVPKGASVSDFSMWINGKEMVGEVVESKRARQIYESYKRRNIDPGLLEQVDYKTFEMRIFPIAAQGEQRVRIVYYQEVDVDADRATYVYPLATNTNGAIDTRTRGRFSLTMHAASEVPITSIDSPSHGDDFVTVSHSPNYAQASLEATGGDLSRDFVLSYKLDRARTGIDVVASNEPGDDGYFQLTLTAGDELAKTDEGADYVFVLDVSGSMKNDGKLALSRGSLDAFVRALGTNDRFDVLAFNVAANPLFRSLRGADDAAMEEAARFLASQRARGGTSLEPALRTAYSYKDADRSLNVVILSDGMADENERSTLLRLIGERPGSTRVFAVGVGNDVNRPLLTQLTHDAGGLAAFISRGDDLERQAAAFRRKLMRPAIANLRIEPQGGGVFDVEPRKLPDLFHGLPVRMYGRYTDAGTVKVRVTGDLDGEAFEQLLEIKLPGNGAKNGADNPEIERMWACYRVNGLLEQGTRAGNRDSVADEVVRLGEGYSIITPYTSFLVLENDGEYQRWKIERRNVTRLQRDQAAQDRVRNQLAALRAKSARQLGPVTQSDPAEQSAANPTAAPQQGVPRRVNTPAIRPKPSRGFDLNLPTRVGGGALDPFGIGLVLALGGLAGASRRRRRDGEAA